MVSKNIFVLKRVNLLITDLKKIGWLWKITKRTIGGLIKIRSKIRSPRTDWFRDLAIRKAKEGGIGAQLSTVVLFNCKTFSI